MGKRGFEPPLWPTGGVGMLRRATFRHFLCLPNARLGIAGAESSMEARSPISASHRRPPPTPCGVACFLRRVPWLALGLAVWLSGCSVFGKRSIVPDSVVACRDLSRQGCAAVELGKWQEAEQLFEEAVAASPVDAEARRQLAEVLWQRGAHTEAVQQIEMAYRVAPHDSSLAVRAGEMRLAEGDSQRAVVWADRAITLDATLAAAWAIRGNAHLAAGELTAALADLHRALSYAPGQRDVLQAIAEIHHRAGRPRQCLTTAQRILDQFAPGEEPQDVLYLEGQAQAALGRQRDAAETFAAAARRGPPRADILCALAQAEVRRGHSAAAAAAARQALVVDVRHAPAIALLAELKNAAPRAEVVR